MKKILLILALMFMGVSFMTSCSSKPVKKDNSKEVQETRQQASQAFDDLDKETK